jgi:hypothetical protein
MLTLEELRSFIAATGEDGNVDAKQAVTWEDAETKAGLAADIAAFANTEGGGVIVIGKEQQEDGTFKISGMTKEQASSFDTTAVASWVNERFAPAISFTCHSIDYEGKLVVVIEVSEFATMPVICVKPCYIAGKKRDAVRRGAIYVRDDSGSSTEIQTRDQVAAVVGRAVVKQQDRLREIFDSVLAGRTASAKPTDEAQFATQADQVEKHLLQGISNSNHGAWRFTIHVESFARIWNSAAELQQVIERNYAKNWYGFPARYIKSQTTEWGIAGAEGGRTVWGLTYEGLFFYWEDYVENFATYKSSRVQSGSMEAPTLPPGKWMDSIKSIYFFASFFDFTAKFAREFAPATHLRIDARASGLRGREFLSSNFNVSSPDIGDYPGSMASAFHFAKTVTAGTLQANWKSIYLECMRQFLDLFPSGADTTDSTVRKWLEKYTSGS